MTKKFLREPFVLLAICIVTYGSLAHTLGFYWDDWPIILMTKAKLSFLEFFQFNRPLSFWIYDLTTPVLGVSPFRWHVFATLLWWLVTVSMWWTIRNLWPRQEIETFAIAALFAVYPAFFQHATAVAFSQHFITSILFFVSIGGMLTFLRTPTRPIWLLIISFLSMILHLITMEYYWGLELIRPVLIWVVLNDQSKLENNRSHLIKIWRPYLIILLLAITWRVFFYPVKEDPNTLVLITNIINDPIMGILNFIQVALRDYLQITIATWYQALSPMLIDFFSPALLFSWLIVTVVTALTWLYFSKQIRANESGQDHYWYHQAIVIGLIAIFVSMTPVWLVGRQTTVGFYSNRLSLPALFGATILLVAVTAWLISSRKLQIGVLSLLIGLGAGTQFRVMNNYRWDWTKQKRFFWQMSWRVPALEENTALISDGTLFTYTGEYPTAMALNTFYSNHDGESNQPYWFFEIDRHFLFNPKPLLNNLPIENQIHQINYAGMGQNVILVTNQAVGGQCLWILSEADITNPAVSDLTKTFLSVSNLDRIIVDVIADQTNFSAILGDEPVPDWCYFFQKAELAKQKGDWNQVMMLLNIVEDRGFEPNNVFEWKTFIEAAGQTGSWEKAQEITLQNYQKDLDVPKLYCSVWDEFIDSTPETTYRNEVISEVFDKLRCRRYR